MGEENAPSPVHWQQREETVLSLSVSREERDPAATVEAVSRSQSIQTPHRPHFCTRDPRWNSAEILSFSSNCLGNYSFNFLLLQIRLK